VEAEAPETQNIPWHSRWHTVNINTELYSKWIYSSLHLRILQSNQWHTIDDNEL